MTVGTIKAMPPNSAMMRRDVKALFLSTFSLLMRLCSFPKWITLESAVVALYQESQSSGSETGCGLFAYFSVTPEPIINDKES